MNVIRGLKKIFWAVVANGATVLATISNILQLVRNTLLMLLEFPGKALKALAVFCGVVVCLPPLLSGDAFFSTVVNMAGYCLVVYLDYLLLKFAYNILYCALRILLDKLDFDILTMNLVRLLQKAVHSYMDNFAEGDPTKKDRLLFLLVLSFINSTSCLTRYVFIFFMHFIRRRLCLVYIISTLTLWGAMPQAIRAGT